jgi:hypothetical protein
MKKGFELIKGKKKEINLSFTHYQSQNLNIKKQEKIEKEDNYNINLSDIEKEFYIENIQNLDKQINILKKAKIFKEKIIEKLEKKSNKTPKKNSKNEKEYYNQKSIYKNKLIEIKNNYNNLEDKLKNEINYIQKVQNEIEDFVMRKYQLKKEKEKLKKLVEQCQNSQNNKKINPRTKISLNTNFNRINTNEITKNYDGIMTTTGNEMCKSRLGNKLLLSLNVGEINKNVNFSKYSLAYPVLKKKKIQFNLDEIDEKYGKKKISLDNYNKFYNANEFIDGSKTVF